MAFTTDIYDFIAHLFQDPYVTLYLLFQHMIEIIFAPAAPALSARRKLRSPRIAVIGAGLTGVSSAAHCVGHGFEVKIFECRPKDKGLGGIWSRVNSTSALQVHSTMYRFHPSVKWNTAYPTQRQIRYEIVSLWKRYNLERRTVFNTPVWSVHKNADGKWVINEAEDEFGVFDGVIAAVGSCGGPKVPQLHNQDKFKGAIYHSSQLDGKNAKGKRVVIVGGGASAVEALEFAVNAGASEIDVLSRSDKWIIPRNFFVNTLLASNVLGQETFLSWFPEWLLRKFFYRDLSDISPAPGKGIFMDTPMVNSDLFDLIRQDKARWLRGDVISVAPDGIIFNHRSRGVPKGGPGHQITVKADIIVMATGFTRPSLSFLPEKVFQHPYEPPNWYLQVFPPQFPDICANNATYVNAIGTVGNFHIGIYTRLLLVFLVDPLSRPTEFWMKRWIDMTRTLKWFAPVGAFDFFTYAELFYWYIFVVAINPFRWKWAAFVFFGLARELPMSVVEKEDRLREMRSSRA
ncbi:hypothetical protein AJ80_02360 [Polytolypa hystricis UAMH7299]|uniref:FAD/NAD(P)-binding domain-containing protein n=1 Tax=Polytolypa hystricis (strain UAMH7299) TaxID=1447883 RepID=A0A2B7YQY1_POLH7|nr:hypothetical protein AJ80_02360 [Polytolypa hystricis UAMH7299]